MLTENYLCEGQLEIFLKQDQKHRDFELKTMLEKRKRKHDIQNKKPNDNCKEKIVVNKETKFGTIKMQPKS